MPEYLAPGVYVEETSYRSKSIEGVSTTTTGFIGPTRYGPTKLDPDIITSLGEFERVYGDGQKLKFGELEMDNFMWHAARAFFTEGGKRLYVSRVFRGSDVTPANPLDGVGSKSIGDVTIQARYPGAYGNFTVRVIARGGPNILGSRLDEDKKRLPTIGALSPLDIVWIKEDLPGSPPVATNGDLFVAERDPVAKPVPWKFSSAPGSAIASPITVRLPRDFNLDPSSGRGDSVRVITLTIEVLSPQGETLGVWTDLPIDPDHVTGGLKDSVFNKFADDRESAALPIVVTGKGGMSGLQVMAALFGDAAGQTTDFDKADNLEKGVVREFRLESGSDGLRPLMGDYEGKADLDQLFRTGLKQFQALEDISIVAAPGSTWNYKEYQDDANAITGLLLAHARDMRYCIAVLDSARVNATLGQTISDVRKMRAKLDSKYAALYYPWVKVMDPITRKVISLPPSGFVCGIYARNDITRAVFKAPANEVVNLALGFDTFLSKSQQEVLNPEGINCFRFFEGRGMLVWGARTISSDPEWKYVNVRRYFAYLERSIERGTQWAVFEPNGERLWANIRRTIEDFLLNEFQMGALLGDKPEKAFFVKCDRTTMNQNDLDNGRLVCLIGVAALKPAEFVIFRIGQWTSDHKV
jgi:phage tail sheath protein FI